MGKWTSLTRWYERQKRALPWRLDANPYRVWLSEIMCQQTQVATVIPYFEKFMARFPTVQDLAGAPEQDVMRLWAGLGYYSRARNLHKGAKLLAVRLAEGRGFPEDVEGWLEVPGVGRYTAGAVVSIVHDKPVPILDGNVERVLSRLGRITDTSTGKRVLWERAAAAVLEAHAGGASPRDFNQALMELGATVCTPRNPSCGGCPLAESCGAKTQGDWEAFPPKKQRKAAVELKEEVHCLVDRKGRSLMELQNGERWRAGLWDWPAKKPAGLKGLEKLGSVRTKHVVTHHKIERVTHVYRTPKHWSAAEPREGTPRWVEPGEVPCGAPVKKAWDLILTEFPGLTRSVI